VSRLIAVSAAPVLVASMLALSSGAANASPAAACTPAPASAVANVLGIDQLHAAGLDGAGLTIGVISTSYNSYSTELYGTPATTAPDDVASGALPGAGNPCGYEQPVQVIQEGPASDDEGRAMLQIVHAIAPAADLVFTTGAGGDDPVSDDQALAAAITSMVDAGVDVIVDDIMLEGDLAFASGFAATAAQRATDAGVIYTVAAGNLNVVGDTFDVDGTPSPSAGYPIGSWQTTQFRGAPCPEAVAAYDPTATLECVDFDPSEAIDTTATYTLYPSSTLAPAQRTALGILQWGEAPYAVTSSFSAYFLDENDEVVASDVITTDPTSPYPVTGTSVFSGLPTDTLSSRSLVIAREVGAGADASAAPLPVRFSFFDNNSPNVVVGAEYFASSGNDTVGSSLVGRAANLSSVTVAAASLLVNPRSLDAYSGIGPQLRYFGAYDAGLAPAPLPVPERREGPTVTGIDVIPTTFFGVLEDGYYLYPGTSAATPVVGATLALAKQAAPSATNRRLVDALVATATPIATTWNGTVPAQTSGAGVVNPTALIAAVRETPAPAPSPAGTASATLPETGPTTDGLAWAAALLALGIAGLLGACARTRRRAA